MEINEYRKLDNKSLLKEFRDDPYSMAKFATSELASVIVLVERLYEKLETIEAKLDKLEKAMESETNGDHN